MTAQDRLKQYIEEDEIYNNYLTRKMNMSDFDKFCVQHCKDIEEILNEVQKLKEVIDKAINYIETHSELAFQTAERNYNGKLEWVDGPKFLTEEATKLLHILSEVE